MSIRTNRQRDDIAERPTPETPEPLEEEARRERAVTDTARDEHEGPGPVYSPSDAYTDGTTRETGDDAVTDGTADADGDGNRFRQPYGEAGDDVLTSPQTGGRHTAESDRLVAGGRTDDHTDSLTSAERSGDAATGAYGAYDDDADRGPEADGAGYGRDGASAGDTATSGDTEVSGDAVKGTTTGTVTGAATGDTVDGPVAYPATTTASGTASVLDEAFDSRWREIKTGFVDDPRQSVEQADALVEEALSALTSRRQALLDQWKENEQGDTEALRLALHEYHALLAHLNRK
ncbi:hypothetical protein SAMN05421833_12840 [Microbispora rosea]|uniref:Uncharacterized protein n=1 Tax=Microbispora rosea TaxID=58117 RepID=A0A1N7GEG6_9ACTN|nr:hypothetical protein [Microbispora rosea]GIH50638.1 hypothetical protein Mro03_58170 [Microbispora rosea subsp. rosea]SIS10902.1 hypothetical protein SAMN05421833_12840 [Microbispora rosea]